MNGMYPNSPGVTADSEERHMVEPGVPVLSFRSK